ncbi:hypothetical protein [Streptomyces sp. NPDC006739]|uniref:hypothetical protein n=1 Tax=Streptomyces sp. NPDC006739 TaxID=3364763 RepID=UPI00368676D1
MLLKLRRGAEAYPGEDVTDAVRIRGATSRLTGAAGSSQGDATTGASPEDEVLDAEIADDDEPEAG